MNKGVQLTRRNKERPR